MKLGGHSNPGTGSSGQLDRTGRDVMVMAIAMAAIIMFVGTGGSVMPKIVRSFQGVGLPPDRLLTNALLLNIALIIFGWRRYRDLTDEVRERSRAEAQARLLAETDPLTGCLNRRAFGPATDSLRAGCKDRGEQIAVVMIDLDNFKRLNDCNGHAAGDAVLRETARRAHALLPDRALIARLGGDEFACAVPFDPARPYLIDRLAAHLVEAICSPVKAEGATIEGVTVSLGLSRSDFASTRHLDSVTSLHPCGNLDIYILLCTDSSIACTFAAWIGDHCAVTAAATARARSHYLSEE